MVLGQNLKSSGLHAVTAVRKSKLDGAVLATGFACVVPFASTPAANTFIAIGTESLIAGQVMCLAQSA